MDCLDRSNMHMIIDQKDIGMGLLIASALVAWGDCMQGSGLVY